MNLIYICLIGYLVGSIPFGFLLTKYYGGIDLREFGSSSTGTTNVLRTGNKKLAMLTLALDVLKGFVFAIVLLLLCDKTTVYFATFCCILGHIYPVWLKFKGGKGAATAAGIFLAMSPIVAVVCAIIWAVVAKLTKTSSIASLSFCFAFAAIVFFEFLFGNTSLYLAIYSAFVLILLLYTHIDNIKRLIKREENKV
ncbi:MAG: glycerol-3-phosphate 1-O-acyltransferase, partial [Clostridia bacterium]|nr:glycerol-3-phosphate 1-O-acyltransferase [Clostridia bacterium]